MTKKQIRKITKELQGYCDRLNEHMPCKSQEDVDALSEIMTELFEKVEKSTLYWSREVFLDGGTNGDKCAYIMTHRECLFVPVCDVEEHIGIKVIYGYEKEKGY